MGKIHPFRNGQEKSRLQHLELSTLVWVGNTPPLANGQERSCLSTSGVNALEFGWVRLSPLANGQEKSGLQHLESCTRVWVGKALLLLMAMRKVIYARNGIMHLSLGGKDFSPC